MFAAHLPTLGFKVKYYQYYQMVISSQKSHHVIIMWPRVIPLSNKEVNQLMLVSNSH